MWARDIGDLNRGEASENPFDRSRERSVSLDIPTHRLNANFIYQLPCGKGKPLFGSVSRGWDLAIGGWELTGTYSYYSGQFLTPLWTGPDPTGTFFTTSRTPAVIAAPGIRTDHLRDANLPADRRTVNRWFDTSAFAAPTSGQFGTAAKGTILGPDVNVWHFGVIKTLVFSDRAPRIRWELTATNLLNHPNWNNPAVNIAQAASAGIITGVGAVNGASTETCQGRDSCGRASESNGRPAFSW